MHDKTFIGISLSVQIIYFLSSWFINNEWNAYYVPHQFNLSNLTNKFPGCGLPDRDSLPLQCKDPNPYPPDHQLKEFTPAKDRAFYADPEKKVLLAVTKPVDLTESIGSLPWNPGKLFILTY